MSSLMRRRREGRQIASRRPFGTFPLVQPEFEQKAAKEAKEESLGLP